MWLRFKKHNRSKFYFSINGQLKKRRTCIHSARVVIQHSLRNVKRIKGSDKMMTACHSEAGMDGNKTGQQKPRNKSRKIRKRRTVDVVYVTLKQ